MAYETCHGAAGRDAVGSDGSSIMLHRAVMEGGVGSGLCGDLSLWWCAAMSVYGSIKRVDSELRDVGLLSRAQ